MSDHVGVWSLWQGEFGHHPRSHLTRHINAVKFMLANVAHGQCRRLAGTCDRFKG